GAEERAEGSARVAGGDADVVAAELGRERMRGCIQPAARRIVPERADDGKGKPAHRLFRVLPVEEAGVRHLPPGGDRADERDGDLAEAVEERGHVAGGGLR